MDNVIKRGSSYPEQQRGQDAGGGMLDTVKEKAKDVAAGVANVAGQVTEKAKEVAGKAWEGTKNAASAVAETAEHGWEGLNGLIRRYPVPAVAVALGVGLLLGQLLASRRHS